MTETTAPDAESTERPTVRVESEAVYAALSAGVIGAIAGIITTWAATVGLWGWPSLGSVAAIVGGGVAAVAAAVGYVRSAGLADQTWRRDLRTWRAVVNTISVTLVHAALAALGTAAVYLVFGLGFVGLVLRPFEGGILAAVTTGLAAYLTYLSACRMDTQRLSTLLLIFVGLGTLTAMASTPQPDWWTYHFSQLGTTNSFSSIAFNGTLIAAGLLVTTFAAYVQIDIGALARTSRLTSRRVRRAIPIMFVVMGVMLAGVGIWPVDVNELLHNLSASGMAAVFLVLLVSSPWLLRGMPGAFFLSTAAIGAGFIASIVLFVVRFFGLTAFEIIVFALIFGWITVFIRFLGVTGRER